MPTWTAPWGPPLFAFIDYTEFGPRLRRAVTDARHLPPGIQCAHPTHAGPCDPAALVELLEWTARRTTYEMFTHGFQGAN